MIEGFLPQIGVAVVRPLFALAPLPLAGTRSLPPLLQASLALALAVFVLPRVTLTKEQLQPTVMIVLLFGEALIGLAIGLALSLALATARIAGELIGGVIGIGFAAAIDPEHGTPVPTVSQFLSLATVALFMAMDGPIVLIGIVAESYRAMPPGSGFDLGRAPLLFGSGSAMFAAAVRLALPVVVATLIVQLAMAQMARLAPSLNMFAVGLPATLVVGLIAFALAFPTMATALKGVIAWSFGLAGGVVQ